MELLQYLQEQSSVLLYGLLLHDLLLILIVLMYEQGPDDYDSAQSDRKRSESQLVSIRKKLIEPNNILPAQMVRSHPPHHILPLPPEHHSKPGHRMPLDSQAFPQPEEELSISRRKFSPRSKNKSKSRLPQFKHKEQYRLPQQEKVQGETQIDPLQFLSGNIKNLLDFPQLVTFISRTAFLSNIKPNRYKPRPFCFKNQVREEAVKFLKSNKHFAATAFAFDQPTQQQFPESLNFDENLQFCDNFESSNLYMAIRGDYNLMQTYRKAGERHQGLYLLTVRLDYNTRSYGQWFYFKVKRVYGNRNSPPVTYKFMIINMTKNSSLFGKGLKVSVCRGGSWGKEGQNIKYYRNSLQRWPCNGEIQHTFPTFTDNYHTLQFSLDLSAGEQIYVSYNEPYSYSRVGRLLDKMSSRYQQNHFNLINFKRAQLCKTYLNNAVEVVTLSAKRAAHPLHLSIDDKKVIFIMARTHPIQTAGSHVVQGILNEIYRFFIEAPKEQSRSHILYRLLQQYILKIIPMANPDGVILGNSRCNLPGFDLNRCWKGPRFDLCKQVYYIKHHVFLYNRRVEMFLDLHAHSKKKNVFAYGCHDTADPFSSRQFPFLLSKLSKQDFLFQECRFTRLADIKTSSQKKSAKDGTARVFLYDSLRIPNIFTIEHSYCSAKNSAYHYDRHSYAVIGADILTAISLYFSPQFKPDFTAQRKQQQERAKTIQNHIKISLNASYTSDLQLKLTINSQKPRTNIINSTHMQQEVSRCKNPNELRQRYLYQLRQRQENIKMGLQKDAQVSQSEEEDRIYEQNTKKKKPKTSSQTGLRKAKGEVKTDRILNYLGKNTNKPSPQKSNKQSVLKISHISSTHSQANLARITKLAKNKFQTMTKPQELVLIPDEACHEQYARERQKLRSRKQRPPTQLQISRRQKDKNCLSIVQIGLNNDSEQRLMQQRIMIIDRFDTKDRLKTFHGFREPKTLRNHTQPKQEVVHRQQKQKDDEIKQYLRRIMKPKQVIQQRQRRQAKERGQKLVEIQQTERSRQSRLQFTDLRMSKLVILQNQKQFRFNHQKSSVHQ